SGSEGPTASDTPSDSRSPEDSPSPTLSPPARSKTPATSPAKSDRVLVSEGGTVVASCTGSLVTLLSWSPAQGYHVVSVNRGPATPAPIRFGHDEARETDTSRLSVFCRNGTPEAKVGDYDRTPDR